MLIIEDDPGIAGSLDRGLRRAGYTTATATTVAAARSAGPHDVVLLDLGLPDGDGVELCAELRARSDAAILVITARGEEPDRVAALDAGADDYIVKPFGFAELTARIRAVLRRSRITETNLLRHGRLSIDTRTRQVICGDTEIPLTPTEFDILECLATDPGRVVTRQEIIERVWNTRWYGPTRVLDVPGGPHGGDELSHGGLVREVVDLDSPFSVGEPADLTLSPGAVSSCYTQRARPTPPPGYRFLPPSSFSHLTSFNADPHACIGFMMYHTAMITSTLS